MGLESPVGGGRGWNRKLFGHMTQDSACSPGRGHFTPVFRTPAPGAVFPVVGLSFKRMKVPSLKVVCLNIPAPCERDDCS